MLRNEFLLLAVFSTYTKSKPLSFFLLGHLLAYHGDLNVLGLAAGLLPAPPPLRGSMVIMRLLWFVLILIEAAAEGEGALRLEPSCWCCDCC